MKWIYKAAVQNILGRIPAPVADPLYHALQQSGRDIPLDVVSQFAFLQEVVGFLGELRGRALQGMTIVEVGSGWHPVLPLLATRALGAAAVLTFDVNRHYSPARIAQTAEAIMKWSIPLAADPVLANTARTGELPACVRYYPRCPVQSCATFTGPAHLALSRSVLEYATPQQISDIHTASLRWLSPDALWVHLVGTSDDRARQDPSLNAFDFLKYDEKQWLRICNNRYAYKNRLRLPQYRSLFASAGWRVAREVATVSEAALAKLPRVPLHADFLSYSPEDLVAGSIRFALSRP